MTEFSKKGSKKIVLLLLVATLLFVSTAYSTPITINSEKGISELLEQVRKAVNKKDYESLSLLLCEDYSYKNFSHGVSKAVVKDLVADGGMKIKKIKILNIKEEENNIRVNLKLYLSGDKWVKDVLITPEGKIKELNIFTVKITVTEDDE